MTKLILVRHGHVEGIEPERVRGRTDLALTPLGRRQADAAAKRVATIWSPAALYTSPMRRCIETGAAIAKAVGLEPKVLESLNDIDYGAWTWRTYDDLRGSEPAAFRLWREEPQWIRFPGGESLQDLVRRAADAVRFALETYPDQTVVLVTHDSVIRVMLVQLLDQPLSAYRRIDQSPTAINEVDMTSDSICVRRINDTAHLEANAG